MRLSRGQGATEYLVLLAVVLIIALVSIALLGFFPGTASDAQATESEIYWKSASPIVITEWLATPHPTYAGYSYITFRIRNTGQYPIRITKVLAAGNNIYQFYKGAGCLDFQDNYYMAPGEEKFLPIAGGLITFLPYSSGSQACQYIYSAAAVCNFPNASTVGTLVVNNFGFEYIQYVEGQQITKRQVGNKPLVIKCTP